MTEILRNYYTKELILTDRYIYIYFQILILKLFVSALFIFLHIFLICCCFLFLTQGAFGIPERLKLKIKHSEIIFFKAFMKKLSFTCFFTPIIVFSKNNCLFIIKNLIFQFLWCRITRRLIILPYFGVKPQVKIRNFDALSMIDSLF